MEDDDMAMTPAERQALIDDIAAAVWAQVIKTGFQSDGTFDSSKPQAKTAAGLVAAAYGKSVQAARRAGVPVDAAEVADAVVDELGTRLVT
jgi:hypothetical protein